VLAVVLELLPVPLVDYKGNVVTSFLLLLLSQQSSLIEVLLLQFTHLELRLLDRVDQLVENALLLVGLFLSDVTLGNQSIVLRLVLEIVQVHLLVGLPVMLFEKHRIPLQVVLVRLQVFCHEFSISPRVEDVGLGLGWADGLG